MSYLKQISTVWQFHAIHVISSDKEFKFSQVSERTMIFLWFKVSKVIKKSRNWYKAVKIISINLLIFVLKQIP